MGSIKNGLLFGYLWLMVGFFTGTWTLLGPVRWLTEALRGAGYTQTMENWAVRGVMIIFLVISAFLAFLCTRWTTSTQHQKIRIGIPIGITLLAVSMLGIWMNPGILTGKDRIAFAENEQFTFGPYPDWERIISLKEHGYTAIIPLLHSAVVPFEPKLLADLESRAKDAGIAVIPAPMLPWVGQNDAALATLRQLASEGKGKYYVHCYLGKDRVNLAKRVVQAEGATVWDMGTRRGKSLAQKGKLERGKIYTLKNDVFVIPYPTDEEFFFYLLTGQIKQVVTILNPSDPNDAKLIEKERKLFEKHKLPFLVHPIPDFPDSTRKASAQTLARRINNLPRPLVVHGYHTHENALRVQEFIQTYQSRN